MSLLVLERVVQSYLHRASGQRVVALRAGSLAVERGEVVAVLGANGSGKSTLLETMAFLRRPDRGAVFLDGRQPWLAGTALAARRCSPVLLQKSVLFSTNVLRNVTFGPRMLGLPTDEVHARALRALDAVGLAGFEQRRHAELSGGEARRVALARVLALDSELLILDEPTAGLDAESSFRIEVLIRRLNRERGTTVILASHALGRAVSLSTRVVTMVAGHLVDDNLDNRTVGMMTRVDGGWAYHDHLGWRHVFDDAVLARDAWAELGPMEGRVHLGVPATGVRVLRAGSHRDSSLRGEVDSIRRERGHARVRVRLPPRRQKVRAEMSIGDFERLELHLGASVELAFEPGAVYVHPAR